MSPFYRLSLSTGFKSAAGACGLFCILLLRPDLRAADPTPGTSDSVVKAAESDSLGPQGVDDSSRADSAEESSIQAETTELTDSLRTSETSDSVWLPTDTLSVAEKTIPVPDGRDSRLASETPDSVFLTPDTLSETGIIIPEPVTIDTVFTEPQSDNPLALQYNGIYLSGITAANSRRLEEFIELSRGTPIGGFIIDMKDDHGRLSYTSNQPLAARIGANTGRLRDPAALVRKLHEEDLIVCARVVTFKDRFLASYIDADSTYPYAVLDSATNTPWQQDNGELWANLYDEQVHDYLLGVIEELVAFGFDQIQLDYTRFPSDGQTGRCKYPGVIDSLNRADVVGLFLSKVRRKLEGHRVSLAVDVFGWVPWLHKNRNYWIGQDYDLIAGYADVVCPMLYSSHFPKEFKAEFKEKRAYHIVREGTFKGVERRGNRSTGVQPYIQGFKWRAPFFSSSYFIDQIRAARESGAVGWIVWNASNNYSTLWEALMGEKNAKAETE